MRIGYLVFNLDGMGGTSRSAITQANALAGDHDVRLISVTRSADVPHYWIDPAITVDYLVDLREEQVDPQQRALQHRESSLVPARWDRQFTAQTDLACERALPALDLDVLVTVTPGLLAIATQLTPDRIAVVHQEHRSSSARSGGLEPLLAYAPRADAVALLTDTMEIWLHEQLGDLCPPTVVLPNPLPLGYAPRSPIDQRVIMAAGRLMPEKQFGKLIQAFATVADDLPGWRLRIFGEGKQRLVLLRQIRRFGLWDRVELPGSVRGLHTEWARASVAAISSSAEGFPLVAQEAMAAGVPVVSFDCAAGPRAIIDHEVNGLLVAPQSMAGLSAALLRIAGDDDLRRDLGRGALHSSHEYDARRLAERWIAVFAEARNRRGDLGRVGARALATPLPRVTDEVPPMADLTPTRARYEALTWCAAAARRADDVWLVIPAHERPSPTVVVPMRARAAFLDAFGADDAPAQLCLRDPNDNGWPERRGPLPRLAADLRRGRTSVVYVEPWPTSDASDPGGAGRATLAGQGCTVEVQFWEEAPDGSLVAPRRNPYTERLPGDRDALTALGLADVEVDGVVCPSLPLLTAPTTGECRFPIDVVYTWVDGADDAWNDAREARLEAVTGTALTRQSSGRARYLDRGELRSSLRSIELFAPWVRRIFLVTAGQRPGWLDADHPRITVVDHRDLLPAEALPTFNSHAIETVLHRIEGLAEHFVYFNDDFLLGRPVRPETFFTPAGLPRVFGSETTIGLSDDPEAAPYLKAAWNNRRLLEDAFGAVVTHNLAHAPYPHRVSTLGELTERFPEALHGTTLSPFRSDTDVSTLSSLAQHYGLLTGQAVEAEASLEFINLANPNVDWQLKHALGRDQDFVCLAEPHDHALISHRLEGYLSDFYDAYWPVPAPWERG